MMVFLSFSSLDRAAAERIQLALLGANHKVFFDEASLPPGGDYHSRIKAAISACDAYVFLISPDSVQDGRYVQSELKQVKAKWPKPWGRVLPVMLRPTDLSLVDAYLAAVTILEPKGNVAAEVMAQLDKLKASRKFRRSGSVEETHINFELAEGIVRLVLAVMVVGLIFWLIIADPVLSDRAISLTKGLLAFALASLMSSMKGFLNVESRGLGWTIRAAGGAAVFCIVWFTSPKVLSGLDPRSVADLRFAQPQLADMRSYNPPSLGSQTHGDGPVAFTIPISATASTKYNKALPAVVSSAEMTIKLDGLVNTLPWLYFVKLTGADTKSYWISDADSPPVPTQALEVNVGKPLYKEVLFASSPSQLTWKQVVTHIAEGKNILLTVTWKSSQSKGEQLVKQECWIDGKTEQKAVSSKLANGNMPGALSFACGQSRKQQ